MNTRSTALKSTVALSLAIAGAMEVGVSAASVDPRTVSRSPLETAPSTSGRPDRPRRASCV